MTLDQAVKQALRAAARNKEDGPFVVYKLGKDHRIVDDFWVGGTIPRKATPVAEFNADEVRHVRAAT